MYSINTGPTFHAQFITSKEGKTGLTVTVDVYNPAGTKVVTDGSATEQAQGGYYYKLADGSATSAGKYVAYFKTTDTTVDQKVIATAEYVIRVDIGSVTGTSVSGPADFKATGFSTHTANDVRDALLAVASSFKADISEVATGADIEGLETLVEDIKAVTDMLATLLESTGTYYRFLARALEEAPGGESSGATADEVVTAMEAEGTKLSLINLLTDKVETMLETAEGLSKFTSAALSNSPAGDAPTVEQIQLALEGEGSALATALEMLNEVPEEVWKVILSTVSAEGNAAAALLASGASGDPLSVVLPGLYTGRQFGAMMYSLLRRIEGILTTLPQQTEDVRRAYRGDTWEMIFSVGVLTGFNPASDKIWITIKGKDTDPDIRAILQANSAQGLKVLMSNTSPTAANAAITVYNETDGEAKLLVKPAASVLIPAGRYLCDWQVKLGEVITTGEWTLVVKEGITRTNQ